MSFPSLEELIAEEAQLVTLPVVIIDLINQIDKSDADLEVIARLISSDAVLVAKVLRFINSAWYGLPMPVNSISQAIGLLGMRELRGLVVATRVAESFQQVRSELIDVRSLWVNTFVSASIARRLAARFALNEERLYTTALLHHLGLLLMLQCMPLPMSRLILHAKGDEQELYRQERALFGYTHADVIAGLLRQWQLPAFFVGACQYHHEFYRASESMQEAAILHLADSIAHSIAPFSYPAQGKLTADLSVFDLLPLDEKGLQQLADDAVSDQGKAVMLFH